MKKKIFFALALVPFFGTAQSPDYSITGKVNPLHVPTHAYLQYVINNGAYTETAEVINGTFVFKGVMEAPVKATLTLDHDGSGMHNDNRKVDAKTIYIENGNMEITATDSIKYATVTGSKVNKEYIRYKTLLAPNQKEYDEIAAIYVGQITIDRLEKKMAEKRRLQIAYAKQNPNSYFSLEALTETSIYGINVKEMLPIFKKLSPALRLSQEGIDYAKLLNIAKLTSVGTIAPAFSQNDVDGKPVKLSDFKGKYVLIDFWASWCHPCRAENPNVVKAYNTFKDKNFTVLGISLDPETKKDAWIRAIEKDSLTWTQVSDLKYFKNAVAILYGIQSIPQNLLIDPTGKIVAKNLHGVELGDKLKEILGEK